MLQEIRLRGAYRIKISSRIISDWLKEYEDYLPFLRMREFAVKKFSGNLKKDFIEESNLFHQQISDREQKQTAHFSVQPVSNETGFSSVSPKPQQTHDFSCRYKTEGFGDDKNYYGFFPLYVVYKLRDKRGKRKIVDKEQKRSEY